ncbi:squalene cyclase [Rhizobium sp. TRM95111]|uniref:squalene cyclase n=1 Tax=Rhizobium alarense TaxID=2846851 RepID=UPI001F334F9B|nr:squalene cyclase [Rhizobium alarense]MCF3639701.1 squalene cyclase [Rhizobium alarense]
MTASLSVIDWLLDSDPAIRWQVLRDLLDAPDAEWQAERAKVETEGWGADLLSRQDADGQWAGGAFMPADYTEEKWRELGQAWTATCFSLQQLHEYGLDPASERAHRTVDLIGRNSRWDEGGQPFWEGEVEECINARTVTAGVYFCVDVSPIVRRLLGERQPDGGWNCERCNGSHRSSFHTTINVLEALLAYEQGGGGTPETRAARAAGEEYLLKRGLFRRLATGEPIDERYLKLLYPTRWRYDLLRALDYFRAASLATGTDRDPRLAEAIGHLRSRRSEDGTWPLDWTMKGPVWFEMEAAGKPSRWITLRALRVLRWWDASTVVGGVV